MKSVKIAAILAMALAVGAAAEQKDCGEAFPKAGVKTLLGVDGTRCVVATMKNMMGTVVQKFMVAKDNSKFVLHQHVAFEGKPEKNTEMTCTDIGKGYTYECVGKVNGKEAPADKLNAVQLHQLFQLVSVQDQRYLFGGLAPWDEGW